MKLVIEALERQLRLEEAAIFSNKIEKDAARSMPGYKGPALHPERPEYIKDLKAAIALLKSPSGADSSVLVEQLRAKNPFKLNTQGSRDRGEGYEEACLMLYSLAQYKSLSGSLQGEQEESNVGFTTVDDSCLPPEPQTPRTPISQPGELDTVGEHPSDKEGEGDGQNELWEGVFHVTDNPRRVHGDEDKWAKDQLMTKYHITRK